MPGLMPAIPSIFFKYFHCLLFLLPAWGENTKPNSCPRQPHAQDMTAFLPPIMKLIFHFLDMKAIFLQVQFA